MSRASNRHNRAAIAQTVLHGSIDFGTTFSASAWSTATHDPQLANIYAVNQYPGGESSQHRDVKEVPTVLVYRIGQKEPVAWGWRALNLWRRQRATDLILASRFKLLLSERENTKHLRQDMRKKLLVDGRTEMNLIVDFLKPFRESILEHIQRAEEGAEIFQTWEQKWTITVPADWSARARRIMLDAADQAGFKGRVKLISEPEAAALCILEQRAAAKRSLSLEAAAVVGDLGGGTSDCATFMISTLEPLSLAGLATIKGIICGAGNLVDNLRRILSSRLRDVANQYLESTRRQSLEKIVDEAVESYHPDLKDFTYEGDDSMMEIVNLSGLREDHDQGFVNSGIEISRRALRLEVFDPVVDEILALLKEQVMASIHARGKSMNHSQKFQIEHIFLTGGLARNEYVYGRVKEAFKKQRFIHYPIEVLKPKDPDTAVVIGAVWKSLHPEKSSVIMSETSYGFRQDESYSETWSYGGPGPVENPITGLPEMKDRMKWVIKKDSKKKFGSTSHRLERYVPIGGSLEFHETMYYSDKFSQDHIHYDHPDIHYFGEIYFDLEKWREQFDKIPHGRDGREYMMVEYALVSTVNEDDWVYQVEVLGSKTTFKEGGRITAGFKLSQGFVAD